MAESGLNGGRNRKVEGWEKGIGWERGEKLLEMNSPSPPPPSPSIYLCTGAWTAICEMQTTFCRFMINDLSSTKRPAFSIWSFGHVGLTFLCSLFWFQKIVQEIADQKISQVMFYAISNTLLPEVVDCHFDERIYTAWLLYYWMVLCKSNKKYIALICFRKWS